MTESELLKAAYADFNARRMEAVLARMREDVEWANGMEGGHVHGVEAVRAYWTRQWGLINPRVEPVKIGAQEEGRFRVEVHQLVRDMEGAVLADVTVHHVYWICDGLIARMDIE